MVEMVFASAEDFASIYASFASGLVALDISDASLRAAEVNFYDTMACSVAGRQAPGVTELAAIVRDWSGKPEASVLWASDALRLPAPSAAWLNGVMAHARDYDDTHDQAILHAGVAVVPATLAAAQLSSVPVKGDDFMAGLVAGLEMTCRLGVATRIGIIESGFIYSSLLGYFGATVAAARVLGFTSEEMTNAIGITFSQAAGTHQVTRDGAMTKRMQPGFAARAALTSVAMARAGIRGAQRSIEGQDGLSRIYLRSSLDSEVLRAGLGERFHFEDLSYKPYPCCRFNHTAIDAALRLRGETGLDWRSIDRITVGTNQQAWEAVATPLEVRRAPKTVVQAQFSICYTVACALVNGKVGLADFTTEALERQDVLALAARVEPAIDAGIEAAWGRSVSPTLLVVEAKGARYEARVDLPKGGAEAPMTEEDLRAKLEDCLRFGGYPVESADRFDRAIRAFRSSEDVRSDIARLANILN